MRRPDNIRSVKFWYELMRIKHSRQSWRKISFEGIKNSPEEPYFVHRMMTQAKEEYRLKKYGEYTKILDLFERRIGQIYYVYNQKDDEYEKRVLTADYDRDVLNKYIEKGILYIHCEKLPRVEEEILRSMKKKFPKLKELIDEFDLRLEFENPDK